MFRRLRRRSRPLDHAQAKDERLAQRRDDLRGPNARTDSVYAGPTRSFVDEGRPRH